MDEKLLVPVPPSLTACYLVPTRMAADQARTIALTGDNMAVSRDLIEHAECGLTLDVSSTLADGGSFRRPEFVADRNLVAFRASCRTGIVPLHEWTTRELAANLATELKVTGIADACAEQWITADEARASLYSKEDGNIRLSDWVRVTAVPAGRAPARAGEPMSLATVGLRRYGLPELRLAEVPSCLMDLWSVALTGLAMRLHWDFVEAVFDAATPGDLPYRTQAPPVFEVPPRVMLSPADVAAAYCLRGRADDYGSVIGLRLDQGAAGTFLTVRPPDDWAQSPRDFLESVTEGPLMSVLKAAALFDDFVTGNADLDEFAARF